MIRFSAPRSAAPVLSQTLALTLGLAALAAPAGAQTTTPRADPPQAQSSAQAQSRDPVAEMLTKGERYRRAPDSKQDPDELRQTQALNAEIVAQNDLAENEDRANQAAQAEAQRRWQAELNQTKADARAARERHEADLRAAGEAQARYDREMADWRATLAACERGDRARCNAGRQGPN